MSAIHALQMRLLLGFAWVGVSSFVLGWAVRDAWPIVRNWPRIGALARWRFRRDWRRVQHGRPVIRIDADIEGACERLGIMLHVADEPHRCEPPHGRDAGDGLGTNWLLPAGPPGSVWRCDCGRLWQAGAGSWFEAGWRVRWRYRRGKALEFTPWEEIR